MVDVWFFRRDSPLNKPARPPHPMYLFGPCGAAWSRLEPVGSVWKRLQPSGAVWSRLEPDLELSGAFWRSLEEPSGAVCLGQSGALWSRLEASGAVWSRLEPSGAVWGRLELCHRMPGELLQKSWNCSFQFGEVRMFAEISRRVYCQNRLETSSAGHLTLVLSSALPPGRHPNDGGQ